MEHVPNDLLVEIIRCGLNYVDRWNLLLTSKQFKRAVMTPRLWTRVTLQTSPIFIVRDQEEQRKNPQPKQIAVNTIVLVQFLHKNFACDVVELDLSDGWFETENAFNQRKYNSYGTHTATPYFWETMLSFPNMTKLSFRNINANEPINQDLKTMLAFAGQKSNITHLNLIKQGLFPMSNSALEMILAACPNLEQLQLSADTEVVMTAEATELFAKYALNLKELLTIKGTFSAAQLSISCPKLETFINLKAKRLSWEEDVEAAEQPTLRPEIAYFSGECKNIWSNKKFTQVEAKQLQKAIQNTSCGDYYNTPLIAKLLEVQHDEDGKVETLLTYLLKQGMDINEQVRAANEVRIDPFKLQFPYDLSFEKERYGNMNYSPLFFYQSEGDSVLHLAVKITTSTKSSHITCKHLSMLLKKGANINLKNKEGKTPICYSLNAKVLKTLVNAGADTTTLDNNGWNVLMSVIANSRYRRVIDEDMMMKMINLLTKKAIDINYEAPDGMNALKVALLCGQLGIARKIKKMMKKLESSCHKGPQLSTLSCLCLSRVKETQVAAQKVLARELLDGGFDALSQDDQGQNALHIACLYQRFDLAKELITHNKNAAELLSAKDRQGYTPLHYAITSYAKTAQEWAFEAKRLEEVAKNILKHFSHFQSFDISVTLSDLIDAAAVLEGVHGHVFDVQATSGETLLHTLCRSFQNDKAPIVKQLLANSANPDIQDSYGQTPLLISCFNLDVKVVKKLLKHKVNVNAADMHGVTPALALCHGFSKEIEELNMHKFNSYRLRAEVEKQIQTHSETATAAFREIFALLVKHNADFTVKDKLIWRTPLHILAGALFEVSDVIEQLVKEFKADVNARDIRNDAPIHHAVRKYSSTHLRKLLELGADINAVGYCGKTVMHAVFSLSDYLSFKGNGELMKGGFKSVGHSLLYYPSWLWNSVEDDDSTVANRRYIFVQDTQAKDLLSSMIVALFEHVDRIDFGVKDFAGSLPIHLMAAWQEENQPANLRNSEVVKKHLTPVQRHLPLPNLFLKFATKEQLSTIGALGQTVAESIVKMLQVSLAPNEIPKEATIQFVKDFIAKGVEPFDEGTIRALISSRNICPEVIDLLFQHTPREVYTNALLMTSRANKTTVWHLSLGNKTDTCMVVPENVSVLMKCVPELLNAYDQDGRTPLIAAAESNSYYAHENKPTKVSKQIQTLLSLPGIEVNKRHRDNGKTALHYAAMTASYVTLIGLFYNNYAMYNNIGVDLGLLALLDAGADLTIKDNSGKTPLDILPSLEVVAKQHRKLLLREEKFSLIDKPVIMIDTNNQQHKALVSAFNLDKLHTFVEEDNIFI